MPDGIISILFVLENGEDPEKKVTNNEAQVKTEADDKGIFLSQGNIWKGKHFHCSV